METFYVGNLEFKASTKDLMDELDRVFWMIRLGDVVIQRKDGRSCCYAFLTLSWARASDIDPFDIYKLYSGMFYVNSQAIYLREPNNKDDTQSSNVGVSSSFIER